MGVQQLPDLYTSSTVINSRPTCTFPSQPYHRVVTNIVLNNNTGATVSAYRGSLFSEPVLRLGTGSQTTYPCNIHIPPGQVFYIQWNNIAQGPAATARISLSRTDSPFDSVPTEGSIPLTISVPFTLPNGAAVGDARQILSGRDYQALASGDTPSLLLSPVVLAGSGFLNSSGLSLIVPNSAGDFSGIADVNVSAPVSSVVFVSNGTHTNAGTGTVLVREGVFVSPGGVIAGSAIVSGSASPVLDGAGVLIGDTTVQLVYTNSQTGVIEGEFLYSHANPAKFVSSPIHAWQSNTVTTQVQEQWQLLTLLNGWTNRGGYVPAQYRMIASPPNSVEIVGNITSGTIAGGTTVFTLPVGYRPTAIYGTPVAGQVTGGSITEFEIETTGNCRIWAANGGGCNFHFIMPLDTL